MTIEATTIEFTYTGDGSTTEFPFPAKFQSTGDIHVGVDGVEVFIGFSVLGAGDDAGGTVTFGAAPAAGVTITLLQDPPITQLTSYVSGGKVLETTLEEALDKGTRIDQFLARGVERSIRIGDFDNSAVAPLPGVAARKGKSIKFNDTSGAPEVWDGPAQIAALTALVQAVGDGFPEITTLATFGGVRFDTLALAKAASAGQATTTNAAWVSAMAWAVATGGLVLIDGWYPISAALAMSPNAAARGNGMFASGFAYVSNGQHHGLVMAAGAEARDFAIHGIGDTGAVPLYYGVYGDFAHGCRVLNLHIVDTDVSCIRLKDCDNAFLFGGFSEGDIGTPYSILLDGCLDTQVVWRSKNCIYGLGATGLDNQGEFETITFSGSTATGTLHPTCAAHFLSGPLARGNTEFTSVAADSGTGKFTFAAGDPVVQGFVVGKILRFANLSEAANNAANFTITAIGGTSNREITVTPAPTTMAADSAFDVTVHEAVVVSGAYPSTYVGTFPVMSVTTRTVTFLLGGTPAMDAVAQGGEAGGILFTNDFPLGGSNDTISVRPNRFAGGLIATHCVFERSWSHAVTINNAPRAKVVNAVADGFVDDTKRLKTSFADTARARNANSFAVEQGFYANCATNDAVVITSTGSVPAGLVAGTTYYVVKRTPNRGTLSGSVYEYGEIALAAAPAGAAIAFTGGSGSHALTLLNKDVRGTVSAIDTAADTLTIPAALYDTLFDGAGVEVDVLAGGTYPGGLAPLTTLTAIYYRAKKVGSNEIELHTNGSLTAKVDITSAGSGTIQVHHCGAVPNRGAFQFKHSTGDGQDQSSFIGVTARGFGGAVTFQEGRYNQAIGVHAIEARYWGALFNSAPDSTLRGITALHMRDNAVWVNGSPRALIDGVTYSVDQRYVGTRGLRLVNSNSCNVDNINPSNAPETAYDIDINCARTVFGMGARCNTGAITDASVSTIYPINERGYVDPTVNGTYDIGMPQFGMTAGRVRLAPVVALSGGGPVTVAVGTRASTGFFRAAAAPPTALASAENAAPVNAIMGTSQVDIVATVAGTPTSAGRLHVSVSGLPTS